MHVVYNTCGIQKFNLYLFNTIWIIYYIVSKINAINILLQFSNTASFFPSHSGWMKQMHVENEFEYESFIAQ